MTIPLGRRRLILSFQVVPGPTRRGDQIAPGFDDHELVRLSRRDEVDIDRARWDGLTLIYGGHRRP